MNGNTLFLQDFMYNYVKDTNMVRASKYAFGTGGLY